MDLLDEQEVIELEEMLTALTAAIIADKNKNDPRPPALADALAPAMPSISIPSVLPTLH